jgi:hypothetical protein
VLLLSLAVRLVIIHCFTLTNAFLASCVPRPKGTEPIDENANAYFKPSWKPTSKLTPPHQPLFLPLFLRKCTRSCNERYSWFTLPHQPLFPACLINPCVKAHQPELSTYYSHIYPRVIFIPGKHISHPHYHQPFSLPNSVTPDRPWKHAQGLLDSKCALWKVKLSWTRLPKSTHRSLRELQIALESLHSGAQGTELGNSRSPWKDQKCASQRENKWRINGPSNQREKEHQYVIPGQHIRHRSYHQLRKYWDT